MTKNKKKILISSIVAPILVAAIIPGTAIAISKTINENLNKGIQLKTDDSSIILNDVYFDNESEMMNYINDNVSYHTLENQYPVKFTVKNDVNEQEFDSVEKINKFISGKITGYDVYTSKEIKTGAMGEISPNEFLFLNGSDRKEKIDIWRGKNDKPYKSEYDAKMSYYQPHDAYFYKDAYFLTKQQLQRYLYLNRDQWYDNKVVSSIKIKAPNEQESQPLQISDLKNGSEETKKYIKNFVRVNAKNIIEYDRNDGSRPDRFDQSQLNNFINSSYYSPNYITVNSNGGKSTYILDSYTSDEGELNGSYLASSSEAMGGFTKTDLWRETTNLDRVKSENESKISILSGYLNSLFSASEIPNPDNTVNNIFFQFSDSSLQKKVDDYYDDLNEYYPNVYLKIKDNFTIAKQGKRYGSFYKIPLLYLMTLDELMRYSADQKTIDDTISVFSEICDFYNKQIYASLGSAVLTHKTKGTREMFSFKSLFGIGNKNLDLNYNIGSLINKILLDYPDFYTGSKASIVFTSFKAKLGHTANMKLDFDMLRENYDLEIEDKLKPWFQTMFDINFTNNYNQLNTANTLFSMTTTDMDKWDPSNYMGISQFNYNNFCEQWISSIVINEAIRYKLIDSDWIYTEKQLELLKTMNFMGVYNVVDENISTKYEDNLKYMRELYEKNNKQIENIFFIILSVFDRHSNESLRKLFGEPELYSNEVYSEKIFSKFQTEVMSNYDLFNEYVNEVFGIQPENISYLARSHDFMSNDYFENSEQNTYTSSNNNGKDFKTITNLPLTSNEANSFVPDFKSVESKGKSFFIVEEVKKENDKNKSSDNPNIKISIPDPNKYGRNAFYEKLSKNKLISDKDWDEILNNVTSLIDTDILNNFINKKLRVDEALVQRITNSMREMMTVYDTDLTALEVNFANLNNTVSRNKTTQYSINRTLNEMIMTHNRVLYNIDTAITGISQQIGYNNNLYKGLIDSNRELVKDISKQNTSISNLNSEIQRHENTKKTNLDKIKQNEKQIQRIKNNETGFPYNKQEIVRLEEQNDILRRQNSQLDSSIKNCKNVRSQLQKQVSANKSQIQKNNKNYQKQINKNKTSTFKAKFGNFFAKFTTAMVYVDMAISLVNLICAFKETVSPLSYIYSNGDVSVIWDGGYRKSRFYGMIKGDTKTIAQANFMTPIQISTPKYDTTYYYNGYNYSSIDELKVVQANDILRGTYNSPNIKFAYTFNKDLENTLEKDYVSSDIDDLGEQIYKALKTYADKIPSGVEKAEDLQTYAGYLPKFAYIYSFASAGSNNIYEIIDGDVMGSIESISSKIKPLKMAYIPKLKPNTRFPQSVDNLPTNVDDGSLIEYELPVKRWDEENNEIVSSSITNKDSYLIVDPNNKEFADLDDNNKLDQKLRELFYNSFDVPKKNILAADFDFIEKFSDFQTNVNQSIIYKAEGAYGQVRYFNDIDKATDWLWNNYGVETHYYTSVSKVYLYENMIFNSRNDLLSWINKNKEVILWKE